MNYYQLETYLSRVRLNRFLVATGHSKTKAKQLYRINLRVSQSFYPALNLFEIVLRNVINDRLANHFGDVNWIITEKTGFMSHSTLHSSNFYLRKCILKTEQSIRRSGGRITAGKIVSEQMFGFWTNLFEPHHYRLVSGSIIQCFPGKPSHVNRNRIFQKLMRIRRFRNRIYHNEPICFNGTSIDFTEAKAVRQEMLELLEWIDEDLVAFIDYFDGIEAKISKLDYL